MTVPDTVAIQNSERALFVMLQKMKASKNIAISLYNIST